MPEGLARKAIILDTDPGIGTPGSDVDDGLAIPLALPFGPPSDKPGLELIAIRVPLMAYMTEFITYWGRLLAGSMLATIPIVILFFALQKFYVQSVTSSGAKG